MRADEARIGGGLAAGGGTGAPGAARTLGLLGGLYVAQGMVHAFFARSLPILMRQQGATLDTVGFSYLVFLPWSLNFLWAPLVDRWYARRLGRRRSWLLPIQLGLVAVLGVVALGRADLAVPVLVGAAIAASFLAATGDVAIDGYAVDRVSPALRGPANGLQIGGHWVGALLGGSVVLLIVDRLGIGAGVGAMAIVVLLVGLAVAVTPEPPPAGPRRGETRRPSLRAFVARPEARLMFLMIVCTRFGDSFSKGMLQPYLVDSGLGLSEIAALIGVAGVGGSLAGSLAGGLVIRPLGRRTALIAAAGLQAASLTGYWVIAASDASWLFGPVIAVQYFCTSVAFVALYTVMMDCCDPAQGGTDFTVQACVGNLVATVGGVLSGWSAAALGYGAHFIAGCVLAALGVAAIPALQRRVAGHLARRAASPQPVQER